MMRKYMVPIFLSLCLASLSLVAPGSTGEAGAAEEAHGSSTEYWQQLDEVVRWKQVEWWMAVVTWNEALKPKPVSPKALPSGGGKKSPSASPSSSASSQTASSSVWDSVAVCESGGNWHINTGNGYFGGLQEGMPFWISHGGLAYAARPDLATREQQITVAEDAGSMNPWPNCGKRG